MAKAATTAAHVYTFPTDSNIGNSFDLLPLLLFRQQSWSADAAPKVRHIFDWGYLKNTSPKAVIKYEYISHGLPDSQAPSPPSALLLLLLLFLLLLLLLLLLLFLQCLILLSMTV
jgi:hypothetical protein